MKRFYDKSEIWFAVTAIIIYVMAVGNARSSFGDGSAALTAVLAVLTAAMVLFLGRNRLFGRYGLDFWPESRRFLYFIPLLVLGLANLVLGVRAHYGVGGQVCAVLSMVMVGFLEEVIFRGLLFEAIAKENRTRAIVISAVTFGVGHIVNLLTGQGSMETVLQMFYAIAIGFALAAVYDRSGSLWPCIAMHALVDVTSVFSNDASPLAEAIEIPEAVFVAAVGAAYAWFVFARCPRRE